MPDENDIIYQGYQIDFVYIGRLLYDIFGFDIISYDELLSFLSSAWDVFTVISFIISFILIIGLIYAYIRYGQMIGLENAQVETEERLYQELYGSGTPNTRWQEVEQHIATDNPNDWKLAIIEADVLLEEALEAAGYAGLTIGDKLKSASPTNFTSLDDAWKAHKLRNQIAHGGADFVLTKRAAQDAVTQYRRVFLEFGVI